MELPLDILKCLFYLSDEKVISRVSKYWYKCTQVKPLRLTNLRMRYKFSYKGEATFEVSDYFPFCKNSYINENTICLHDCMKSDLCEGKSFVIILDIVAYVIKLTSSNLYFYDSDLNGYTVLEILAKDFNLNVDLKKKLSVADLIDIARLIRQVKW